MKKTSLSSTLAINSIRVYQQFLQPAVKLILLSLLGHYSACKHDPTCSQYTIHQIRNHGTITGLKRGLQRIVQCR